VEWVEVTAKTIAEAKDKALDYLGVDEAQAEFENLEEPRVGLFRRVRGEARVRARIMPARPRPKAERRDRRRPRTGERTGGRESSGGRSRSGGEGRGEGRGDARGGDAGGSGGGTRARGGRPRGERSPAAPRQNGGSPSPTDEPVVAVEVAETAVARPVAERYEPQRGDQDVDSDLESTDPSTRSEGAGDDGRQLEYAKEFLAGLAESFGVEATVSSERIDDYLDEAQLTGSDLGMLIGPKAITLEAVQELTRVVAQRRSGGRGEARLRVDIGGYRKRRRGALERFARAQAEEVLASGAQKVLEPMNSADRKVVHDTVGTLEGVRTLSEGEEPRRRVVIVPA
jgi:spoIIIJ-associated protein